MVISKFIAALVVMGIIVVAALALGLGLGLGLAGKNTNHTDNERIDCYPEARWGNDTVTRNLCEARGCCYTETSWIDVPVCHICRDRALGAGYRAEVQSDTGTKMVINLISNFGSANGASTSSWVKPSDAVMEVDLSAEDVIRFKMYPKIHEPRYEVPKKVLDLNYPPPGSQRKYFFKIIAHNPFSFIISRVSTGAVIFDTGVGGLVLADQFLSFSTRLPSENIYGFGENTHQTFKHDLKFRTWPMFARDQGTGGVINHYGVHPFYTCLEKDGNSHGVLILNSNAMDYTLTPLPMLTYRTIGGVLDVYVIMGPTPENVIQQYTGMIGRPYMPPYWSLGFQLCRYGYDNLQNLSAAVNRTRAADIPQDVQYADIDHYDERKVFTVDNVTFPNLKGYFQSLRDNGMRIIIILDPCLIANDSTYHPFEAGLSAEMYIRWPNRTIQPDLDFNMINTTDMLGYVWPKGPVVFPDYLKNATFNVWKDLIVQHHNQVPFDGLWIDMNEPANFGTNEERPWNWPVDEHPYWSLKCPTGPLDDPPYATMATYGFNEEARRSNRAGARLSDKTLCMLAVQGDNQEYTHYDVHNLYGTSQIPSTLRGMREAIPSERGMVFGRSTFPGSGNLSGHWLGDNHSQWPDLRESIIGMLEFNLFGIPYVGADICGFFGDTTDELCKRWMQLGAFYPFSRNHNALGNVVEQDPGSLSVEAQNASRIALNIRYSLLPHLYTLFHSAHVSGDTVVRPLHHEFPKDGNTWAIDQQFLWGKGLLFAPILYEGQTSLKYYLPGARWYDFYMNELIEAGSGQWKEMVVTPQSNLPIFVREGTILPMQIPALNTNSSRQNNFFVQAYLSGSGDVRASGDLFWDDGVGIDTYENGAYHYATLQSTQSSFQMTIRHSNATDIPSLRLSYVSLIGVTPRPTNVLVNNVNTAFTYTEATQVLNVTELNHPMNVNLTISWS